MRRVAALLLGVASVLAADAQTPTTTTDPVFAPPTQIYTVKGTFPDLEGRWLLVSKVGIGNNPGRVVASLWNVTRKDGQPFLEERLVVFPPEQVKAMEEANQKSGGDWTPTPADIQVVRDGWDTLAPEGRGVTSIATEFFAPDGYDDQIKKEPMTKDAQWIARQLYEFQPGGGRPVKQVNVMSAMSREGDVITGNYMTVMVAAAPFPIPIKFEGNFKLIRLGDAVTPSRGFLARVMDFFSGCNGK
jgi:hypothetical protein